MGIYRTSARLTFCFLVLLPGVVSGQLAIDKCKFLGNVIAGSVPSDFRTYWNQVTPENSGKWGSVEATRDVMSWANLDVAYNAARNNDFPLSSTPLYGASSSPVGLVVSR